MPPISASAAMRSASWPRRASAPASSNGRWRSRSRRCSRSASARCRLRTRGVYFIMITLAFAQMVYYVAIGLDRYGGDDGLTIHRRSQFGGLDRSRQQDAVLLSLPRAAAGEHLSRLAPGQFALRPGDPGRALERPAHARHRLSDLPLQARLLRHRRRACAGSPARCCQSHRLHQPGDDALDALRRSDRHGGARRHGVRCSAR